jgi:prepilin-type N-terminal cleavage/methylation domain-containing protein
MKIKKGFTLIEILVVVSIIGFITSVVLISLQSAKEKAEASKIIQNLDQFKKSLELYRNDYGFYPVQDDYNISTEEFLYNELVVKKYISEIPNFGESIEYGSDGDNSMLSCDGKIIKEYYFMFTTNNKYINLPIMELNGEPMVQFGPAYCIGQ